MNCGLLGRHLSHSYSPQIHRLLGDYSYDLFEKEPEELANFLLEGNFTGLNVTIPYKKEVIPFCQELSPRAKALGAVNTLVRRSDGSLIGHNTDYYGFSSMLDRTGLKVSGKKVLVLGSGGASATVCAVLQERGADYVVISRQGPNSYENLQLHRNAAVIVNATPVGMYPHNGTSPLSVNDFPNLEGVLDLIYNPARTALLLEAEKQGCITENGLWMLVAQAKESAEWFTGVSIPDSRVQDIYKGLRHQMENIVLIGMPGCGKSSLGQLLAETTGKTFVDADDEIIKAAGCTIPEIFSSSGEAGFRKIETQVLASLGKASNQVIATGGGCVTRAENYPLLHQNGRILWIRRPLSQLPTNGRPLSQNGKLGQMYRQREPLYRAFCDAAYDNCGSLQNLCAKICTQEEF